MGLDSGQTLALSDLLDYPGDRFAQGFACGVLPVAVIQCAIVA
jgi:hypothetical protein